MYVCILGFVMSTGPIDIMKILLGIVPGPLPCENMGFFITGAPVAVNILGDGMPMVNLMTIVLVTPVDDEAGILLGMVSETMIAPAKILAGNPVLLFLGAPAAVMGISMGPGNAINTMVDTPFGGIVNWGM